jgi:hypothetical protein
MTWIGRQPFDAILLTTGNERTNERKALKRAREKKRLPIFETKAKREVLRRWFDKTGQPVASPLQGHDTFC